MSNIETMFAPAERADIKSILQEAKELNGTKLAKDIVYEVPTTLMVLNQYRQVVFMNQRLTDEFGGGVEEVLGKRPGEIIKCVHANERDTGCGTTESCRECGVTTTILWVEKNQVREQEDFSVITDDGGALDLKIWASPYSINSKDYIIVNLLNIADEKRRQVLEHTLFHDMNSTLKVITNYSSLLVGGIKPDESEFYEEIVRSATKRLVDEISSRRDLFEAENEELYVQLSQINSMKLMSDIIRVFSEYDEWKNRPVIVGGLAEEFEFFSDRSLLTRVLVNMVKNAIEATTEGGDVVITCIQSGGTCVFSVNNPSFMPRSIQLQVFQRSFSTKGTGRGVGTYSMKLFGEKYLHGRVWFTSSEEEGTTFNISIPSDGSNLSSTINMAELNQ